MPISTVAGGIGQLAAYMATPSGLIMPAAAIGCALDELAPSESLASVCVVPWASGGTLGRSVKPAAQQVGQPGGRLNPRRAREGYFLSKQ